MPGAQAGEIAQRLEHLLDVVIEWQLVVRYRPDNFRSPVPPSIVDPGLHCRHTAPC
jgi:hypothetical protein